MDIPRSWNICPVEIMIIIFELLDITSLHHCMHVSKLWREIATKVISTKGLWQTLVENFMLNGGKSFLRKSKLHWHGIYMNSLQWYDAKNTGLEPAHKLDSSIKNFFINRDNIIIVTEDNYVKYFSIETLKCVRTIHYECKHFEESDDIILTTSVSFYVAMLYGKRHKKDYRCLETSPVVRPNVLFHRLEDNEVYIMTIDTKILYIYAWENFKWKTSTIRFYGPAEIITGLFHDKRMYILAAGGKTYNTYESMISFETYKNSNYALPSTMDMKSLGIFGEDILVIIGDTKRSEYHYTYDAATNTVFIECPGLTSFTQHGDVLLLGSRSGKVQIFIPFNMLKNEGKPELSFYIRSKLPIIGLDVYESIDAHDIFIQTASNLIHFRMPFLEYSGFSECYDLE